MSLNNPSNWARVFEGVFQMAQFGPYRGQIEPIWTPPLTQHTIRVYASSSEAKLHWKYAGELTQVVGVEGMETSRSKVYLNRWCLFFLPQLVLEYKLKFECPYWHKRMKLVVEVYTA
jgi:hypothetical protein